jgi:hypothetical protein
MEIEVATARFFVLGINIQSGLGQPNRVGNMGTRWGDTIRYLGLGYNLLNRYHTILTYITGILVFWLNCY